MALTQVTSGGIKDSEVKNADMADDSVGIAELSATGTASNTTYLRGDNTWTTPPDNNTVYTHPNHSGEVTSAGDGATTITDDVVDEANLKISNAGSDGQYLQKQSGNTGGLTWATVTTGGGGAVGTDYDDNVKVRWGTGKDLEIYHDPDINIINAVAGNLEIRHGVDKMIACTVGGQVGLYFDSAEKLTTTNTGILVTGDAKVGDSSSLIIGNGDDLQIYHNGTNSYIDNDTGKLQIDSVGGIEIHSTSLIIYKDGTSEKMAEFVEDGACRLFHDSVQKLNTHTDGIEILGKLYMADNKNIELGNGQDFKIYHDGANSILDNNTGQLRIQGDLIRLMNSAGSKVALEANVDDNVELYFNNVLKFETTTSGATCTGWLQGDQVYATDYIKVSDGDEFYCGNDNDLQIFHDGTDSYIKNKTGDLYIKATNADTGIKVGSNGDIEFPNGGLILSEADQGINFSGGSFLTGKTTSVLDDYEQGTFDCKMITNSGTFPTQTVVGHYIKIGHSVTVHGQIQFAATNGSGTGLCWIELPFNVTNGRGGIALGIVSGFEWSAGHQLFLAAEINSQALYVLETEPNSAGHTHLSPASVINAGSSLFSFGGTYVCQ